MCLILVEFILEKQKSRQIPPARVSYMDPMGDFIMAHTIFIMSMFAAIVVYVYIDQLYHMSS